MFKKPIFSSYTWASECSLPEASWVGGRGARAPPSVGFLENFGNLRSVRLFGENMESCKFLCRAAVKMINCKSVDSFRNTLISSSIVLHDCVVGLRLSDIIGNASHCGNNDVTKIETHHAAVN